MYNSSFTGWADGTHIPVCRPGGGLQRPFYCGHHKVFRFRYVSGLKLNIVFDRYTASKHWEL